MNGSAVCLGLELLIGLPVIFSAVYLMLVVCFSARAIPPACPDRSLRFDVIIPAHNEAANIEATVTSARALDWPADLFQVIVVADNCSDDTAGIARATGARVLERQSTDERGKGYALRFAFEHSHRAGWADAVVVIDADSEASSNLLEAFAARIARGADAAQADYAVLNPGAAWRTRLMAIAMGAFHVARSRARERLQLSCGIRGNGWCLMHRLLQRVPYQAFSLTEDIEYGLDLGIAGYRVHYVDEGHVKGEMVSNARSAADQRRRWEQGRFELIRKRTLPLLRAAVRNRSRVCLDLALDLMLLPLSYIAMGTMALLAVAVYDAIVHSAFGGLWLTTACALALVCYVLRGWQLSGVGLRGLADLAWAPVFIVWKAMLMLRSRRVREWVRTERERP
jgi:1,2-diacylglycerol 3-beta-glucosyltransferase